MYSTWLALQKQEGIKNIFQMWMTGHTDIIKLGAILINSAISLKSYVLSIYLNKN